MQFLSIPVYTYVHFTAHRRRTRHILTVISIFKNLTIILIAYGEVFMFGASVTGLTLVSFALMVGSSIIAAWSDIRHAVTSTPVLDPITGLDIAAPAHTLAGVNIGYIWMALNCVASAAYVLYMRKRIKVTGFKDWDSMYYNNLLSIPVLVVASLVVEDWGSASLTRNLYVILIRGIVKSAGSRGEKLMEKPSRQPYDPPLGHCLFWRRRRLYFVHHRLVCARMRQHYLLYGEPPCSAYTLYTLSRFNYVIPRFTLLAAFSPVLMSLCPAVYGCQDTANALKKVGALNKLPVAASGMLFFGDPANFGNVTAIGVGGVAGLVYAVAKTNQAKVDKARAALGGKQ